MNKGQMGALRIFLSGVGLWIIAVALRLMDSGILVQWAWLAPALCIASGVMVLVTSFVCLHFGGPFAGHLVRIAFLLGLAVYSNWEVGKNTAITVLVITILALVPAVLALRKPREN